MANSMQQGCPLSPLRFVPTLEPLLHRPRANSDIKRLPMGSGTSFGLGERPLSRWMSSQETYTSYKLCQLKNSHRHSFPHTDGFAGTWFGFPSILDSERPTERKEIGPRDLKYYWSCHLTRSGRLARPHQYQKTGLNFRDHTLNLSFTMYQV